MKGQNGKSLAANALLPPNLDTDAFSAAVIGEACRRLGQFSNGIRNYQNHPRQPRHQEPPVIWTSGTTRLLDYGVLNTVQSAPPVLIIPSLINRAYILDLAPDRSLMRYLADAGLRPLLVDWGWPGETENKFGLDDYIAERLQAALEFVSRQTTTRPALIGYCMGGNLALALAGRNPDTVSALGLLATPWDFHSDNHSSARFLEIMAPALGRIISELGMLPVDMLQAMFASLDPAQTGAKFRHFAGAVNDSKAVARFIMLEDWVNDGVPLAGKVASECLFGWYRDNTPHLGKWAIRGDIVDPSRVTCPTFVAIPSRDHIVPPGSARALACALPSADILTPAAGHIGMVAGRRAEVQLYEPLRSWLSERLLSN